MFHAHQPAGNSSTFLEECYRTAYNPFLTMIEKASGVRLALHYSGPLLLWIEKTIRNISTGCANWWPPAVWN